MSNAIATGRPAANASNTLFAELAHSAGRSTTVEVATSAADSQAGALQLNTVLDAIGQAVCIYDIDGRVVWSNSKAQQLPGQVSERIRKYCTEAFSRPERTPPGGAATMAGWKLGGRAKRMCSPSSNRSFGLQINHKGRKNGR